ncbi:hypothetical protein C457_15195 [Haloferax prahovense DSM 18310]|uniref:Uncharacterized protein n=1 Tax=Haloferax prahovense (strain DSM 18310 / JCM 13924 / TL6) TaxID=1227461 RepID=M0G3I1_HALPT|nr:hypothetical protein [Haloferax prahovense]ELZ66133.1 hypothetical protein C457_15195 [Haloferax prahovense DSM 18310]
MSDDTEADVTDREPSVEDDDGHGVTVDGGGDAGASSPEESEEADAERPSEGEEPDAEDEMREQEAAETENVDNHRDGEPFDS